MFSRKVHINEWDVEYIFTPDGYDYDTIMDAMKNAEAPNGALLEASDIMNGIELMNTGFTYVNSKKHKAAVIIGPSSSYAEMIDTFTHETYHLAVSITELYGYDLSGEIPAYLIGDIARAFADVICQIGCDMYGYLQKRLSR